MTRLCTLLFLLSFVLSSNPALGEGSNKGDRVLENKLDRALTLVRDNPTFRNYSNRLDSLRSTGAIRLSSTLEKGTVAFATNIIEVGRKEVAKRDVRFIAAALVHEAVHMGQDDTAYASVEEIEWKAYQMGGRFKLKVGLKPNVLELAAIRLPRSRFIREANTIWTSWSGIEGRMVALTLDAHSLKITKLPKLRELARKNGVRLADKMPRAQLIENLADRFNVGGLSKLSRANLGILARIQGIVGNSRMNKADLVKSLTNRLDPHRLDVYSFNHLKKLAIRQGINKPLRTRKETIKAISRSDLRATRRINKSTKAKAVKNKARVRIR